MEIKNQHEEIVLGKLRWQGQDGPIRVNSPTTKPRL